MSTTTDTGPTFAPTDTLEIGHDTANPLALTGYGQQRAVNEFGVTEPEYVPALTWPNSNLVYRRMASDAKIASVLRAVTMPVRAAKRALDPTGCDPTVVEHIAADLGLPILGSDANPRRAVARNRDRFSFSDHVRLALESLTYGHAFFEQQARLDGDTGFEVAHLRKLAPRFQDTIQEIVTARDGGLVGIRQYPPPGLSSRHTVEPLIPVSKLVAYSFERRGAAWQGRSLLRPLYGAWFTKDEALRTWALSNRRAGIGVPQYIGPEGATQKQINDGAALAQQMRAGEASGVGIPYGAQIKFQGVEGTLPEHEALVRYCDESMAGAVLAEFLKLGSSSSGSRALGDTFVDFFTLALEAVDAFFADTFSEHVIEDLVDWTYGTDEPAPRLVTTQRIGTDEEAVATAVSGLLQSGALTKDASLEAFVRRAVGLPELDAATAVPGAVVASRRPFAVEATTGEIGSYGREITTVEAAAGFDPAAVDATWRTALAALLAQWQAVRADQVDALLDQIEGLLSSGDVAGLGRLSAAAGTGVPALTAALTQMAADAAKQAAAEAASQGLTAAAANVADLAESLTARAVAVDALIASGLANAASRQALIRLGAPVADVIAGVREHLEGLSDAYLEEQLGGALTAAQNQARVATFTPLNDDAYVYASELLDSATCRPCATIDGYRFADMAEFEAQYPSGGNKDCEGGARCRGTGVLVRKEAAPTT